MNNPELIVSKKLKWSEKMVLSTIYRRKDTLAFGKSEKGKWDYTTGLLKYLTLKVL